MPTCRERVANKKINRENKDGGGVKMMLSHDKQHFVNTRKKEHYNQHHGERDWRKTKLTTTVIKL